MAKIPLYGKHGQGKFALVDDEDYEEIDKHTWVVGSHGYAQRGVYQEGKTTIILLHRKIIGAQKGQIVDHINRDKLDNRRSNLRIANQAQNMRNCDVRKTNTSGYKGVHWHKQNQKWKVEITKDYKNIHIGTFDDLEEAARAYDAMAVKLFGEFARLNFPDDPIIEIKPKLRSDNISGYRGVSWNSRRNKWQAQVNKGGKRFYSCYFDCKNEAALMYNEKAVEAFGEKAKLNEIKSEAVV